MGDSMSVAHLILGATIPVKIVMLILVGLSVMSWYIIWQRALVIGRARKTMQQFEERFWSGVDLSRLFVQVSNESQPDSGQENIFKAGFKEFARLRKSKSADGESVMDGAERAMRVALSREQEKLERHLSFLATVGSTSPYIGLFGTVWGIMHSFLALANQKQATLATVAPGIAEALIATAIGLFAAIPAVVAYNRFATGVDGLLHSYETFLQEFSGILHRKAHSGDNAE